MRWLRGGAFATMVVVGAALALFLAWAAMRGDRADMPWTPLDLGETPGATTGRKLAALGDDLPRCEALLRRAGVRWATLPPRRDGPRCSYDDAIRFAAGGSRSIAYRPAGLGIACPVAAGLAMWEWHVVQPAAERHFGTGVTAIEHFGSYNCRRIYGRDAGTWSEHATADAVDIAAFRLTDGRRISVVRDWSGGDAARRAFLHDVRDGACGLFATTLSPDYNAAHRDHLHLDQSARGVAGWRACR